MSMISRVLWHPGISRGARKLTRTPSLSKKKKKDINNSKYMIEYGFIENNCILV